MSILAFGGEMGSMIPSDSSVKESTTSTRFDATFSRAAMSASGTTAYADTAAFSVTADVWVKVMLALNGFSSTSTKHRIVELLDGSNVAFVRLTADWATTQISNFSVEYLSGATWTSIGAFSMDVGSPQDIDFHVVANTSSGSVNLYVAGTLRASSGTINLSSYGGVAKVRQWGHSAGIPSPSYVSQFVAASEPTIGMRVGTIYMTGQGNTHTFDTGGFANIDEAIYADADFIQSGTAAQIEQFTGTAVPTFTGYTIRALALTARAKTSGSAPTKMRFSLRSAGTDYLSGSDITLDFGYGAFCGIWETNPATSAAFLASEIPALQYGVKSVT